MGVLKVNVGTALSPDWRKIGCGGTPTVTIADTFDRANSTTTINPASDGGTWTVEGGTFGIVGNKGYLAAGSAPGTPLLNTISRSVGSAVMSVQADVAVASVFLDSWLLIGYTPAAVGSGLSGTGYTLQYDSGGSVALTTLDSSGGRGSVGGWTIPAFTGSSATFRVDYDGAGNFTVWMNGVVLGTATDALIFNPAPYTGTYAGWASDRRGGGTGVTVDNFTATGGTTGRLKLWDGTQWVQETCDTITPVITFADDFNRSNRALSGDNGWTDGKGVMQILSNVARWTSAGPSGFTTTYRPGSATSGTYAVDKGTNVNAWLMVRHDLSLGFILIRGDFAFKWDTATLSFTLLATLSGTSGAQRIGVTITGDTFAVTEDGVSVGSFTTSAYSGGAAQVGLYVSDAAATLDNFSITDVPVTRPLYVWTGTAWDRVACMVPA